MRRCFCKCHNAVAVLFGVDVTHPVEAEAACDLCKAEHPSRNRQAFVPPVQWKPETDIQADGEGRE